ncbi:MAG: hypothetical protein J3K34DRAFT_520872 [Monoraphidium minutum]|nr:MAG: hypothetical protein J3K34DRAFT_520872 [Monoraphidium minutum]
MGAPKRMLSFSQRPGFPSGLRVLLVTSCASCAEAVVQLSSCSPSGFDVLLADKGAIGCAAAAAAAPAKAAPAPAAKPGRSGLLESCKGLPCILMAADPSPGDVLAGIGLGAVDFLAKPLSELKLRNIWQHTVRKMMADMQIACAVSAGAKGAPPAKAAAPVPAKGPAPPPTLVLPACGEQQQQQGAAPPPAASPPAASPPAASPPAKPSGLPPRAPGARSPVLRAARQRPRLHACVSSTNLAVSGPATFEADEDLDFDFDAAEDACACTGPQPAATPSATAATATATATHVSAPAPSGGAPAAPSCGVPVAGSLGSLSSGMVWGMPMPAVRAPGIPVGRNGAAPPPQQQQQPAPWGYMGCGPPPGFMAPPPYMMAPPPGMCGPYGYTAAPSPYGWAPPPMPPAAAFHQHRAAAPAPAPTAAAAAAALDASLMSLLGSAEDDGDLDFDDVLQELSGGGAAAADAADAAACGGAAPAPAAGSPGSNASSLDAAPLPRVASAGALAAAVGDDLDAYLAGCGAGGCGALGLDDWEVHLPLRKSGSLADLLASPLVVA